MIYASLAPVSQPPPNLAGGLGGYPPVPVELCTCNRLELMYRTGWFVKIVPIWPRYPMYTDNVDILNFLLLLKGKVSRGKPNTRTHWKLTIQTCHSQDLNGPTNKLGSKWEEQESSSDLPFASGQNPANRDIWKFYPNKNWLFQKYFQ